MRGEGLGRGQRTLKRLFDLVVAGVLLVVTSPLLAAALLAARVSTRDSAIFRQTRIGRDGEPFQVLKVRTMRGGGGTTVTQEGNPRITRAGAVIRRYKLDELPQLVNVLRGEMSLVGPRPDVAGYADELRGRDRIVLSVRPGITGPAAVAYRDEERMLRGADDAEAYNRDVIWPDKVRINRQYVESWSLGSDVAALVATFRSVVGG